MTHPKPFPRTPDDLPQAWINPEGGRFTESYERRAELLWDAVAAEGLTPRLDWAGSQDGEALLGVGPDDELVVCVHLEDPIDQQDADAHLAAGTVREWLLNP